LFIFRLMSFRLLALLLLPILRRGFFFIRAFFVVSSLVGSPGSASIFGCLLLSFRGREGSCPLELEVHGMLRNESGLGVTDRQCSLTPSGPMLTSLSRADSALLSWRSSRAIQFCRIAAFLSPTVTPSNRRDCAHACPASHVKSRSSDAAATGPDRGLRTSRFRPARMLQQLMIHSTAREHLFHECRDHWRGADDLA
jgi:hypothetical protein